MKRIRHLKLLLVLVMCLLVASVGLMRGGSLVAAQIGGGYDLTWHKIAGGGITFSNTGGYELGGTIAQPEAGALSGGGYSLHGGFWEGDGNAITITQMSIYLPLVIK